jgi:hypothetical protein
MPGTPFRPYFRLPPRTNRWIPSKATAVILEPITAGALTWTGSSVTASVQASITAGALTWTGRTVAATVSNPITAGQVTWTGRTVTASVSVAITAGTLTWQGQTITVLGAFFGEAVCFAEALETVGVAASRNTTGEAHARELVSVGTAEDTCA